MFIRRSLILAVLLTASGCSCHEKVGNIHPARELVQYRPKTPGAKIDAVSLGTSDSNNFDESKVATSFPAGTARVLVWYQWHGVDTARQVQVRWFKGDKRVLQQEDKLDKPFGESAWALYSPSGKLPAGSYHVELVENGQTVSSIPFTVGG